MKICITAANCFIGLPLVKRASSLGWKDIAVVRVGNKQKDYIASIPNVKVIELNLEDYGELGSLVGPVDCSVLLTWNGTRGQTRLDEELQKSNYENNMKAVKSLIEHGCKRIITAGSQAEYGLQTVPLTPDLPVNPESGYGIAKYTAGKMSKMLCQQLGMRFNWMRILSVYGKKDNSYTLISYVINELKAGRSPELTKCEQIWDYIHCDDVARAFLAVAEKGVDGKFYPLGSGEGRKLSEYIKDIRDVINPDIELGFGKKNYYPHQPMFLVADSIELEKDVGWTPWVSFHNGIKNII